MKKLVWLLLCALLLTGCAPSEKTEEPKGIAVFTPDYLCTPGDEPEDPEARLAWRRDVVEKQMRYMATVRWQVDQEITYSYTGIAAGKATDSTTIHLKPGRIYQGIPYTHGAGSGYSFLSYATSRDENGVYMLSGMNREVLDGVARNTEFSRSRVGNDCADCVFWAWAQVSPTISFMHTNHMTEYYGCVKVGDYEQNSPIMNTNTVQTCADNGQQRMFAAYAQLQKGDGMVRIVDSGGGHAVMIVSCHVEYTDGQIDGAKSYVTVLEQTDGAEVAEKTETDAQTGEVIYLCEITDEQWDFNYLYKKGYLPITCKELVDSSPLAEVQVTDSIQDPGVDTLFSGVVKSNYRISGVTITITDTGGNVVQRAVGHGLETEPNAFNLYRFTDKIEQPVIIGGIDIESLDKGTYRCTFDCTVSTGENVRFRGFEFSI